MLKGFQDAYELLHDSILIVDLKMIIRFANSSSSACFGYPLSELKGHNVDLLIPESSKAAHSQHANHYTDRPKHRQMNTGQRLLARKRDGSEFPVSISLNPITIGHDKFICAVIRDLSELAAIEEELAQKKRMESLSTIVGGVSHDINNMMTAVRGSIYMARRRPERYEHYLNIIETQCEYATDIVKEMLITTTNDNIDTEIYSLSAALQKAKPLFSASINNDVHITFDIPAADVYINGSENLLNRAIVNLIQNARDAVAASTAPAITITLREIGSSNKEAPDKAYLCLSIHDNGHGIDEATAARIFEPFYTTKSITKGTGLGLAMVYNIAQLCGGYIDVDSSIDNGATFNIFLPMVENKPSKHGHVETIIKDVNALLTECQKSAKGDAALLELRK
ncbi:MAG: ATP-binding protein [Mariprofundus sp.]|nr:ATP-binding protein [Mariprofundus sp.]